MLEDIAGNGQLEATARQGYFAVTHDQCLVEVRIAEHSSVGIDSDDEGAGRSEVELALCPPPRAHVEDALRGSGMCQHSITKAQEVPAVFEVRVVEPIESVLPART